MLNICNAYSMIQWPHFRCDWRVIQGLYIYKLNNVWNLMWTQPFQTNFTLPNDFSVWINSSQCSYWTSHGSSWIHFSEFLVPILFKESGRKNWKQHLNVDFGFVMSSQRYGYKSQWQRQWVISFTMRLLQKNTLALLSHLLRQHQLIKSLSWWLFLLNLCCTILV